MILAIELADLAMAIDLASNMELFSVGCVLSHMCILTLCTELAIPLHVLGILHTHGKAVFRADRRMEILYLI